MDNYEITFSDDCVKDRIKIEEILTDKNLINDVPYVSHSKFKEIYQSPDCKPGAEKRVRQLVQSRPDIHSVDNKSFNVKKIHEFKDLDKTTISKVPFLPLLSIRTTAIEEMYKEIKEMRLSISELEERNKVNMQCIDIGNIKIRDLEDKYFSLKKKAGLDFSCDDRREELKAKLMQISSSWTKSVKAMRQTISELEQLASNLSIKSDAIKNQIFRRGRQQKIFKNDIDTKGHSAENGYHSCDLLNSSVQTKTVIHTPSWNTLHGSSI
jgi:hypothetical protein